MPHVVIHLATGRTEEQKVKLTEAVTKVVMAEADCEEDAVSVDIQDTPMREWMAKIYNTVILPRMERLYKKPGYKPF